MALPQTQARKVEVSIKRPSEEGTRADKASWKDLRAQTTASGGGTTDTNLLYVNNDTTIYIQAATFGFDGADVSEAVNILLTLRDDASSSISKWFFNPQQFPVIFDPPLKLQQDWSLRATVTNHHTANVTWDMSANYFTE